jgi:hypothetical protein
MLGVCQAVMCMQEVKVLTCANSLTSSSPVPERELRQLLIGNLLIRLSPSLAFESEDRGSATNFRPATTSRGVWVAGSRTPLLLLVIVNSSSE